MSEKGLLSKSIANNISEAIIDKLGGSGYVPTEWSKNINLLGIASADIEEALASITEDTSSSDKGLLSLSIASDMGAILNKKYNTSRGFKPSEVSSAVSALIPLPEKTTPSAPVCSFSDGADTVPLKSWEVEIAPTLTGKSAIEATQTGKNLFDKTTITPNSIIGHGTGVISSNNSYFLSDYIPVKAGMVIYFTGFNYWYQSYFDANKELSSSIPSNTAKATIPSGVSWLRVSGQNTNIDTAQLEVGESATDYEIGKAPTQYTVSLGRTIYGGQADIVNGVGQDGCAKDSMTSTYLSGLSSSYIGYEASTNYFGGHPTIWVRNWNYQTAKTRQAGGIGCDCYYFPVSMHNTDIINTQNRIYFDVNGKGISDVSGFIAFVQNLEENNESLDIVYELENKTDFTFDGQEIPTRLGYNAFWADEGDTEVTYRADLDLYEAPSMLLGANNTETEGNEEQEVNE